MRLLKKDTTFCWDERAQESFDALKRALASAPMISPPDYSRDFLIYVAASMETIGMLLELLILLNQNHTNRLHGHDHIKKKITL